MASKTCRTCGHDLPISEFTRLSKNASGEYRYMPDCKECRNKKRREKYQEDSDYRARKIASAKKYNAEITYQ